MTGTRSASALALAFVVGGPALVVLGAVAAADEATLTAQAPHALAGGGTGVALTATGAVVLGILRRRRSVAERLDALDRLVASVGSAS